MAELLIGKENLKKVLKERKPGKFGIMGLAYIPGVHPGHLVALLRLQEKVDYSMVVLIPFGTYAASFDSTKATIENCKEHATAVASLLPTEYAYLSEDVFKYETAEYKNYIQEFLQHPEILNYINSHNRDLLPDTILKKSWNFPIIIEPLMSTMYSEINDVCEENNIELINIKVIKDVLMFKTFLYPNILEHLPWPESLRGFVKVGRNMKILYNDTWRDTFNYMPSRSHKYLKAELPGWKPGLSSSSFPSHVNELSEIYDHGKKCLSNDVCKFDTYSLVDIDFHGDLLFKEASVDAYNKGECVFCIAGNTPQSYYWPFDMLWCGASNIDCLITDWKNGNKIVRNYFSKETQDQIEQYTHQAMEERTPDKSAYQILSEYLFSYYRNRM